MDLLEKKIEKLEQTTDGGAACNTILYLVKRINEQNRDQVIAALMRYGDNGLVEFHRGFAVSKVVELMDKPDSAYSDFFMSCIQSGDSSKAYWGIVGYVKAVGKAACNALIPFVSVSYTHLDVYKRQLQYSCDFHYGKDQAGR